MMSTVALSSAVVVSAAVAAVRRIRTALLPLAIVLLGGCAVLPADVARAPSEALLDVGATPLARIATASTPDDKRHLSGFRLLPHGGEALAIRTALARRARQSLDVQYYVVAADDTGRQFLRELRDAAARGVRVRLLVDDLHAADATQLLATLAAHANVEVRLFNPLPARSGRLATRVLLSLHEFERVNRRMHNKLFIADNSFAVTGGRNIADEYFMRGEVANFIDMDVVSTGPVVRELSDVFDRFWNSALAFPIDALAGTGVATRAAREQFETLVSGIADRKRHVGDVVAAQLDSGRVELQFAPVHVYADDPAKAAGGAESNPPATAMDSTLNLFRSARSEVSIASPYFIPGQRGLDLMREATANGVRIAVMTNSLAATDEPLAYWGYARYRFEMLKIGVTLSELSPTHSRASGVVGDFRSSLGRLHAKVAVVDRRWVLVGSMNMDRRSSRANTEIGLVIDSAELASEVAATLQQDWASSNYRLRVADSGTGIEWVTPAGDSERVHGDEPDVDWLVRIRLGLLSAFVSEDLL